VTPDWHPDAADEVVTWARQSRRLAIQAGRIFVEVSRAADGGLARWPADSSAAPRVQWWSTEDLTAYAVESGAGLVVLHITRTARPFDFARGLRVSRLRWQDQG
jgi:hypothetical protein